MDHAGQSHDSKVLEGYRKYVKGLKEEIANLERSEPQPWSHAEQELVTLRGQLKDITELVGRYEINFLSL